MTQLAEESLGKLDLKYHTHDGNDSPRIKYSKLILDNAVTQIASNNNRYTATDSSATASASYVKVLELSLKESIANLRMVFNIYISTTGGTAGYGKIYKNGVAIGVERVNDGSVSQEITVTAEDFSNLLPGDLIQVYAKATSCTVTIKSFKIGYDNILVTNNTNIIRLN